MMIKIVSSLSTFHKVLFQILTLDALAVRTASHAHTVTLTVFLKAVAFEAFAFDLHGQRPSQKKFFLISAILALTLSSTGLSQFKALTVVFLTASPGAGTLTDRLRIGTSRGGTVGNLQPSLIFQIAGRNFEDGWLIVIVERAFFGELRLRPQQVEQVRVVFCLLQAVHHDHNLLLHVHLLGLLLTIHIKLKQLSHQYSKRLKVASLAGYSHQFFIFFPEKPFKKIDYKLESMQVQQKEEKMEAGCFMKKNAGWAAENTLLCCLEPF